MVRTCDIRHMIMSATPPNMQMLGSIGSKGACLRMREIVAFRRLFFSFLFKSHAIATCRPVGPINGSDDASCWHSHYRLNGSSSPVLTATCLSYGSLCDFLIFFLNRPGGHTFRPILTQNGSNDVGSRKDVPFGVKITTF